MAGCGDPDMVTYSVYQELAEGEYIYNEKLQEIAANRFENVTGWWLWAPLAHIPLIALEYLYEAKMTYCYGFYKSSIFCCAAVLDLELKRALIKKNSEDIKTIERQTFGQSIDHLEKKKPNIPHYEMIDELREINKIRNKVSVHCGKRDILVSSVDRKGDMILESDQFKDYFNDDEIKTIENEAHDEKIDWLEHLALKTVKKTKILIANSYS